MAQATNGTMEDSHDRKRDARGRIVEEYPLEDVHEALATLGSAGTQEVADKLGSSYETAYHKLRALEDADKVTSRKVGNARLWEASSDE